MAKFCSYCGKQLEDGAVCDCPGAVAAMEESAAQAAAQTAAAPQQSVAANKAKGILNDAVAYFKAYIKTPAAAVTGVLKTGKLTMSIVWMAVNALLLGIFMYAGFSKIIDIAQEGIEEYGGEIEVAVPFITTIIFGILITAILLALVSLAVFAIVRIAGVNATFRQVVVTVGCSTVLQSACLLLALVCLLISIKLCLIFLVLGTYAWMIVSVYTTIKVFGIKDSGKFMMLAALFVAIVYFANMYISTSLTLTAAGKIEVEDEKIEDYIEDFKDELDELKDMDFEEIIYNFI